MSASSDDFEFKVDSSIGIPQVAVYGYVLAGGRSSRMGTDKSTIEVDGQTALQRQLDLVGRFCGAGVAVVGASIDLQSAVVLADRGGRQGPLDGIVTALQHAQTISSKGSVLALVLAVDLWNISADEISRLFGVLADPVLGPETDVAYLHGSDGAGDQPLGALWRVTECLEILTDAFEGGERSVLRAWTGLRRTAVVVSKFAVANINTPDDVEQWRSRQTGILDREDGEGLARRRNSNR